MSANMPRKVAEGGQLTLYVKGEDRKQLLESVAEQWPSARSLSDAVFSSLDDWHRIQNGYSARARAGLRCFLDAVPLIYDSESSSAEERVSAYILLFSGELISRIRALQDPGGGGLGRNLSPEEAEALDKVVGLLGGGKLGIDWEEMVKRFFGKCAVTDGPNHRGG